MPSRVHIVEAVYCCIARVVLFGISLTLSWIKQEDYDVYFSFGLANFVFLP